MTEPVHGEADWINQTGLPEPRRGIGRAALAPSPDQLLCVLSQIANSSVVGERRAHAPPRAGGHRGRCDRPPRSRRLAPPLRTTRRLTSRHLLHCARQSAGDVRPNARPSERSGCPSFAIIMSIDTRDIRENDRRHRLEFWRSTAVRLSTPRFRLAVRTRTS